MASEGPLRVTDEFWMEDASLAVLVCATEDRRFIPRGNYRALLCRKCDIAIHTTNPYVSSHQRFVLTGVKTSEIKSSSMSKSEAPMAFKSEYNKVLPSTVGVENSVPTQVSYGGVLRLESFNHCKWTIYLG
ncbi:hypothetical protein V6N12_031438 [Hibiscus sabdariffa]|uniref:Uncharacterized protein n=1 Tax=Hibiscus sabdariffa TaxID=183260 RepID=A0ABR2B226_9ROSI